LYRKLKFCHCPIPLPQVKKANGANNKIVSPQNFRNFISLSFSNTTKPKQQILRKNRALFIIQKSTANFHKSKSALLHPAGHFLLKIHEFMPKIVFDIQIKLCGKDACKY